MLKQDNLYLGDDARLSLMNGVAKIANAVGITMGTSGKNALIECIQNPQSFVTNDGYTIAKSIKLIDPIEEIGASILRQAINRANKSSGDGSSTTCILTSAILQEGMKHIGKVSPMEIKRSLEACIPLIEKSINDQKKEIDVNSVSQVASISAEDESIGNMIQEIYEKIGKEGIISWDISKTAEDSYTIGTGLTINGATFVSPYMCDVDESSGAFLSEVKLNNVPVLLYRQKITSGHEFNDFFFKLNQEGKKEVVIFCDEIEFPAIANFIKTRIEKGFRIVVVKMPVLWRDEWWEDLALTSGGTIISSVLGVSLNNLTKEHLGTFEHIKITKEDTYIDGIKDISKHIFALQFEATDASLLRASRLNTKTARYYVGAQSESALSYKRLKVEDAINAASCALDDGIVAGGGIALLNTSKELNLDTIGGIILQEALKAPFKQIMTNFGKPDAMINGNAKTLGFDTRSGEIVNMFDAGIVDPTDVVLNAVKSAIGVSASILTCGTVITLPREEEVAPKMPLMR